VISDRPATPKHSSTARRYQFDIQSAPVTSNFDVSVGKWCMPSVTGATKNILTDLEIFYDPPIWTCVPNRTDRRTDGRMAAIHNTAPAGRTIQQYTPKISTTNKQILCQCDTLVEICVYFSIKAFTFQRNFSGRPGLADTRMSLFSTLLELRMMEVVETTGTIRRAKRQSNRHHQQNNTQLFTGRMLFLSPDQQCHSIEGKLLAY